ncbi:MAG TPA: hypothetical protein VHK44_07980, partial [Xanthobacteraceae bacterium]|nr:hypothetical protein [Xanthobacteraceae bacterium]
AHDHEKDDQRIHLQKHDRHDRHRHFGELKEMKQRFLKTAGVLDVGTAMAQIIGKSGCQLQRQKIHQNVTRDLGGFHQKASTAGSGVRCRSGLGSEIRDMA